MKFERQIVISASSGNRSRKVADNHSLAVNVNPRSPRHAVASNPFQSRSTFSRWLIGHVLSMSALPEIDSPIVESISVPMIRLGLVRQSQDNAMHPHSLVSANVPIVPFRRSPNRVSCIAAFVKFSDAPIPSAKERVVACVHDCVESLRKGYRHTINTINRDRPAMFVTRIARGMAVQVAARFTLYGAPLRVVGCGDWCFCSASTLAITDWNNHQGGV